VESGFEWVGSGFNFSVAMVKLEGSFLPFMGRNVSMPSIRCAKILKRPFFL
jgi:hypothetical protein